MIYLFKPHALHASSYLLKSHATLFISCHKITGVHRFPPSVQRVEISPPMTSCSPCGAWPFDVNLCRNRRLHEENNFIWGSLCLGSQVFLPHSLLLTSPLLISEEGTIIPPLPSPSLLFLLSCFSFHREGKNKRKKTKKNSSPFSPMHPEIHLPTPVYSLAITYQPSYLHFHLKKAPYCIYILWLYQIFFSFFYCECFCAAPLILFSSLLVALMWNVCAEPIECCVYIKATLFLTIPAFVWVWLHRTERKTKKQDCHGCNAAQEKTKTKL